MYVFLHLACCCSCIAVSLSPIPSLRDRCSLRTAARPSLRCRMPLSSIRTSARGASNRFRPSPLLFTGQMTPILHSHRLRRTCRNGGMELWPAVQRKDGAGSTTMSRQRYQRRCSDFIYRERDEFQPSAYAHGSDLIDPEFQHHSMEGTCGCSEEEEPTFFLNTTSTQPYQETRPRRAPNTTTPTTTRQRHPITSVSQPPFYSSTYDNK